MLEYFPQTFFSWDCAWALRLLICCWDRDTASSFCWEARSLSWRSATSLSSSMILERSDTVATYSRTFGEEVLRQRGGRRVETADLGCRVWTKYEQLLEPVYTSLLVGFNCKIFDLLSSEFSKENQIIIRMLFINIVGLQLMNVWMDGQFNKSLTGILSFYLSKNWKP